MRTLFATPRTDRRARSDLRASSPGGERRGFQIGPKIRIGGTLGKIGQKVKIATGKALSNPIVDGALTLIPGVGPGLAAAAGATGRVLDTSSGGLHGAQGLVDVAKGAAEGYGAGKIAGGLKSLVTAGAAHFGAGGGGGSGAPYGGAAGDDSENTGEENPGDTYDAGTASSSSDSGGGFLDEAKKLISGGGTDGKGNFGLLGDLAGKAASAFGGGSLLDKGLLAASIADAAAQRKKKEDLLNQGLSYEKTAYDARQPLRDRGLQLLQDETPPDLSSIFTNAQNPYTKAVPAPQIGASVPLAQPKTATAGAY